MPKLQTVPSLPCCRLGSLSGNSRHSPIIALRRFGLYPSAIIIASYFWRFHIFHKLLPTLLEAFLFHHYKPRYPYPSSSLPSILFCETLLHPLLPSPPFSLLFCRKPLSVFHSSLYFFSSFFYPNCVPCPNFISPTCQKSIHLSSIPHVWQVARVWPYNRRDWLVIWFSRRFHYIR